MENDHGYLIPQRGECEWWYIKGGIILSVHFNNSGSEESTEARKGGLIGEDGHKASLSKYTSCTRGLASSGFLVGRPHICRYETAIWSLVSFVHFLINCRCITLDYDYAEEWRHMGNPLPGWLSHHRPTTITGMSQQCSHYTIGLWERRPPNWTVQIGRSCHLPGVLVEASMKFKSLNRVNRQATSFRILTQNWFNRFSRVIKAA